MCLIFDEGGSRVDEVEWTERISCRVRVSEMVLPVGHRKLSVR